MTGPHPAVADVRVAVRRCLREVVGEVAREGDPPPLVLAAVSGGGDSLALAAALAFEAPRAGARAGAVVVDHGLQERSEAIARAAADACAGLGLDPVRVERVDVPAGADGPEAAARTARYAALDAVADALGAAAILLGHTRDDQAEQVLLGLARGSGARSLAGMPARRGRYARPLLGLPRERTRAACAAAGLSPWDDPHNADPAFARVRARAALDDLDAALGPGVRAALARSADLLRDDADLLDALAADARAALGEAPWPARTLADLPRSLRGRVWRRLATEAGCPPGALTAAHVAALDTLVIDHRGQGPIPLPGGRVAARFSGAVTIGPAGRVEWAGHAPRER